ncbi:MAG: hypothetical protein H6829_01585 [Planctomycetes bacterium]|nr:hypothetical protein [Planctomycetota bacterium]HRV81053.1 isoprenylcysteine carboxylmethyltransferase family protein [Planctomycetota bacterium]
MSYHSSLVHSGHRWFRWRSFAPLALLVLLVWTAWRAEPMFQSRFWNGAWQVGCLGVGLFGLGLRAHVVGYSPEGTSGRNRACQRADALNTTGLYSLTRNPLYLGNFFLWLGPALFVHDGLLLVIVVQFFWLVHERIVLAEEAYLGEKFGDAYTQWAQVTPVFLPRRSGYVAPTEPFCWRRVVQREYAGLVGLVGTLYLLKACGDWAQYGRLVWDPFWTPLMVLACVVFGILRWTKKWTGRRQPNDH